MPTLRFYSDTDWDFFLPWAEHHTVMIRVCYDWWLVRGTLLMELGLLRDFLGIFPHEVKDIIFTLRGTWGGCEMRMATQSENTHARWLLHGGGDNLTHNVRWAQCENDHMRWDLQSHLMSMRDNFATLNPCKIAMLSHMGAHQSFK